MKKEQIIKLLELEERRLSNFDRTSEVHHCSMRSMVQQILLQEAQEQQRKKPWVSWRRLGLYFLHFFNAVVYAVGFVVMFLVTCLFSYVLWDFYKRFFGF